MEMTDQEFGAEVLRFRSGRFIDNLVALLTDFSDETVHQARVESRRTRAALQAFQEMFPSRPFHSVYAAVRQITRTLGRPRETAVSLKLLREVSQNGAAVPPCLKYLRKRLHSQLEKQEERIQRELHRMDPSRLRSKFEFLLSVMESDDAVLPPRSETAGTARPARLHTSRPSQPTLFQMREDALQQCFRTLARYTKPLSDYDIRRFDSANDEELHRLRIAAKKARYAMEIYSSIGPGGFSGCIEKTRAFQETAGLYHDWCVLRLYMDRQIESLSHDSLDLAFEIGSLAEKVAFRKAALRKDMQGALLQLQDSVSGMLRVYRSSAASHPMAGPLMARNVNIRAGGSRKRA